MKVTVHLQQKDLDCDGNQLDCVGGMTADLTWIGDGWCDDGAFGMYLDCEHLTMMMVTVVTV